MNVFNILANPGVGNLMLLLAAIIGVGGSYCIYKKQLSDRKYGTRTALRTEIESNKVLERWMESSEDMPEQIVQPTVVYEENADNIWLLSAEEREYIGKFYSEAILLNDALEWNREMTSKLAISTDTNTSINQRRNTIRQNMNRLAVYRWQALQTLKKHIGEPHADMENLEIPETAGETVAEDHPILDARSEQLVSNGYFELTNEGLYRMTEEGEEKFLDS